MKKSGGNDGGSGKSSNHKFENPSLKKMFQAISNMAKLYRNRSWPSERLDWESDMKNECGLSGLSAVLYCLKLGGYVKQKGGNSLTWNKDRIMDAARRMPEHLKKPSERLSNLIASTIPAKHQFELDGDTRCFFVDDLESFDVILTDPIFKDSEDGNEVVVALDCEGVPDSLELIQVASKQSVYLIDCKVLGAELVCEKLKLLLQSTAVIKILHDLHKDAVALDRFGSIKLEGVLDTQLVAEFLWGELLVGFNALLSKLELATHPSKDFVHARMKSGADLFSTRPIPQNYLEYAAMDVSYLSAARPTLFNLLGKQDLEALIFASTQRADAAVKNNGMRAFCFDIVNDYALASAELVRTMRIEDGYFGEKLEVQSDVKEVVEILPPNLQKKFINASARNPDRKENLFRQLLLLPVNTESRKQEREGLEDLLPCDKLSDIVLDVGRRPQCWIEDERVFLCDDEKEVVKDEEMQYVEERLGRFGSDNRAGLDGKLHRFSAMRNRDKKISGITIRIGRHVKGNAAMLMDFLLGSDKSILILGEPGSGKTTIVREATRRLAERKNVVVVDTSNEIAGDGRVPHECIGLARRMMVPSLDAQSSVMVECVQNHTPHVMVIDEIGRPREVQAARTVKQRGVRMIASAHGDLRRLLKNKDLSGLVGGVEQVTMGDEMAKQEAKRKEQLASKQSSETRSFTVSKTKVQRGGEPTFDCIIEVRRGSRHEWRVVSDSARAVDNILDGFHYKAQLRARDPETGAMRMELVEA